MTTMDLQRVRLRELPVKLWQESRAWFEELVREFTVIASSDGPNTEVPRALIEFVADVTDRFSRFSQANAIEGQIAQDNGRDHIDLEFDVPVAAASAARDLWRHIERAERFCREGELLSLPPSMEVRAFIEWYLTEVEQQIEGSEPRSWSQVTPR